MCVFLTGELIKILVGSVAGGILLMATGICCYCIAKALNRRAQRRVGGHSPIYMRDLSHGESQL